MSKGTNIKWQKSGQPMSASGTDEGGTLNAIVGCSPVSAGCVNCYATSECWRKQFNSRMAKDFAGTVKKVGSKLIWTGKVNFLPKRLYPVLEDHSFRSWFVNSLSDQFHENLSEANTLECFGVFNKAYWQEFRILTKREERLLAFDSKIRWTPNIRMGVSVEDTDHLYRIAVLGRTSAQHKWISFEPWLTSKWCDTATHIRSVFQRGITIEGKTYSRLRDLLIDAGIECSIVGGESSIDKERARPLALDDIHYILEETAAMGAHPVLKQLGTRWAIQSNTYGRGRGTRHGAVKNLWPKEFQKYREDWPFLTLPEWKQPPASSTEPTKSSEQ